MNFREILKSNFMKIRPVVGGGGSSCSVPTDGKTEMTKFTVDFRNFSKAPKNSLYLLIRMSGCKSGAEEKHLMTPVLLNDVYV